MLERIDALLSLIKTSLSYQPGLEPASNNFEGGVGVTYVYKKNYTTPPPEITLAALRLMLHDIPRPYPREVQAKATSIALTITQRVPDLTLPEGSFPVNPKASEAAGKLQKRIRQSKKSAKFLLNQVGYRVPDCSDAIDEVIVDSLKLLRAKREYESL